MPVCLNWYSHLDDRINVVTASQFCMAAEEMVVEMESETSCKVFPFSALTLLFGRQENTRPIKNWVLVYWW